jgi:hypothetical protein
MFIYGQELYSMVPVYSLNLIYSTNNSSHSTFGALVTLLCLVRAANG